MSFVAIIAHPRTVTDIGIGTQVPVVSKSTGKSKYLLLVLVNTKISIDF